MRIELNEVGKRFNRDWILKGVSAVFKDQESIGLIGSNGSGKTTLLKIISAAELPSKGTLTYFSEEEKKLELNEVHKKLSFAAPYMELPEQLNPVELFNFHSNFKSFQHNLEVELFLELIGLSSAKHKMIRNFSSGMKQRLKLGLAICTSSPVLLLDEPCSNLDKAGILVYHKLMDEYSSGRIIIIGSNEQAAELYKVSKTINVLDYK